MKAEREIETEINNIRIRRIKTDLILIIKDNQFRMA